VIDFFEWTDKGNYSFANIVNLKAVGKFLCRGINANINNSTIKIKEVLAGGVIKINGGTILLEYNSDTNAIFPLAHGTVSGYTDYSELWLSNLSIEIDNDDPLL